MRLVCHLNPCRLCQDGTSNWLWPLPHFYISLCVNPAIHAAWCVFNQFCNHSERQAPLGKVSWPQVISSYLCWNMSWSPSCVFCLTWSRSQRQRERECVCVCVCVIFLSSKQCSFAILLQSTDVSWKQCHCRFCKKICTVSGVMYKICIQNSAKISDHKFSVWRK
jgi:hypothetical protein